MTAYKAEVLRLCCNKVVTALLLYLVVNLVRFGSLFGQSRTSSTVLRGKHAESSSFDVMHSEAETLWKLS